MVTPSRRYLTVWILSKNLLEEELIMTDRERFLNTAKGYIGTNGNFVCKTNLGLGAVYDWCAFAVSAIMKDCGFIGKYIKAVAGGAGDVPRT